jgi:toxin ParE1/3/4
MANKIRISFQAKQDLEDIIAYTSRRWSNKKAKEYIDDLRAIIGLLKSNPHLGKSIDHIIINARFLNINSHTIYYNLDEESTIFIDRILHKNSDYLSSF